MSNKILSTLNIGNNFYEIDDAFARQKIAEMDNTITEMEDKVNGRLTQQEENIEDITMRPSEAAELLEIATYKGESDE